MMIDLAPELTHIIGEQPPVPDLPPRDARARFQTVLRRFISVFAQPSHPLALFLDDVQWLDGATLDLFDDLLTSSGVEHLLLIGAYRDNEVTAAHPLMRKLDAIRNAGAHVQAITLAPLAGTHVEQLVADALHCEPDRAAPLARLVYEKTAGNPFFLMQFLHTLVEEGCLAFDHEQACLRDRQEPLSRTTGQAVIPPALSGISPIGEMPGSQRWTNLFRFSVLVLASRLLSHTANDRC